MLNGSNSIIFIPPSFAKKDTKRIEPDKYKKTFIILFIL